MFDSAEQGAARFAGEEPGYIYTRLGNPTTRELELKVAALEGMADAAATATGMGAVAAATMAFLQQGDHLIASKAIYGCSFALFNHQFARYGIDVSFVDMTDHCGCCGSTSNLTPKCCLPKPRLTRIWWCWIWSFWANFAKSTALYR